MGLTKNVGKTDKTLRIIFGLVLLGGFVYTKNLLFLIGLIPLATGLLNYCPLYSILGINTCKKS